MSFTSLGMPSFVVEDGVFSMFGLIVKMTIAHGQRDEFIGILVEGTGAMPGCFCYVVAKDLQDENAVWVTEVWDSKESHAASLLLPEVKTAISKGKPLVASVESTVITTPIGGFGLGSIQTTENT